MTRRGGDKGTRRVKLWQWLRFSLSPPPLVSLSGGLLVRQYPCQEIIVSDSRSPEGRLTRTRVLHTHLRRVDLHLTGMK